MKGYYQAYGLSILSDINLPALLSIKKNVDSTVNVLLGKVPNEYLRSDANFYANPKELYFNINNVAKYYVKDGKDVTIQPAKGLNNEVLLYFYSNCLAAILLQRNKLPFHASGVILPNRKVALFAGDCGVGKSTIVTKLRELGYPLFTDDTLLLSNQDQNVYATASYPLLKLWENTFKEQNTFKRKRVLGKNIEKYGFHFHDKFEDEPLEVEAIFFLNKDDKPIQISELKSVDVFERLLKNVYRKEWIGIMKKQMLQFNAVTSLSASLKGYYACRPSSIDTFQEFSEAIHTKIKSIID